MTTVDSRISIRSIKALQQPMDEGKRISNVPVTEGEMGSSVLYSEEYVLCENAVYI